MTEPAGIPGRSSTRSTQAEANGADMTALLERCARTPEPVFEDLVKSALAGQRRAMPAASAGSRLMLALSRPVSTETLGAALTLSQSAVSSVRGRAHARRQGH